MKLQISLLPLAIDFITNVNKYIEEKYHEKPMGIMVFSPVGIGKTQQVETIVSDPASVCYGMPFKYVPVGQMSIDELSFVPDVNNVKNGRCGRAYLSPEWVDRPAVVLMDECDRCQNPTVLDQAVSWAMDRQHPFAPAKGSVVILCGNGIYDDNTIEIDKRIRTRCCILDVTSSSEAFMDYMKTKKIKSELFGGTLRNFPMDEVDGNDSNTDAVNQIRTARTYMWAIHSAVYFYSSVENKKKYEKIILPVLSGLIRQDAAISLINDMKITAMHLPSNVEEIDDDTPVIEPLVLNKWMDRILTMVLTEKSDKNTKMVKLTKLGSFVKKCSNEAYRSYKLKLMQSGYHLTETNTTGEDKQNKTPNKDDPTAYLKKDIGLMRR